MTDATGRRTDRPPQAVHRVVEHVIVAAAMVLVPVGRQRPCRFRVRWATDSGYERVRSFEGGAVHRSSEVSGDQQHQAKQEGDARRAAARTLPAHRTHHAQIVNDQLHIVANLMR